MNKKIQNLSKTERKSRRKRRFLRTFVVTLGVLVVIRLLLPVVILSLINKKLETLPNYKCVVKDFNISFIDQSITLKGIEMTKKNGKIDVPFFLSDDIHVSVESFENRTSKIVVDDCILNLVKGKNEELSQLSIDDELKEIFKKMPLKPNTFIVKKAEIHFIEKYRSPDVDLSVKNITVEGWNIENQNKSKAKYPATILINGDFEGGKLHAKAELNKQKKNPLVRIVSSLSPIQVSNAKNFLKLYADLNVESGTLSATSIINIYDGRLDGFIDPVAKNLVFKQYTKKKKVKFIKRLKKPILNAVAKIIGKGKDKKIETRIELHGTMGEIKLDVWEIILKGLKNSFAIVDKDD